MDLISYLPGTFCWADLATPDGEAAKQFYGELFGWSLVDLAEAETDAYTLARVADIDVCALGALDADKRSRGRSPQWTSYVSVQSTDEICDGAERLDGSVIIPSRDIADLGRLAVIQDPTGAQLAVWQGKSHAGDKLIEQVNTLIEQVNTPCWHELLTRDTDVATRFYTELLGWHAQEPQIIGEGASCTLLCNSGQNVATIIDIQQEWGELPAQWIVYFAVDACDEAVERAGTCGATLISPVRDAPSVGRVALVQDPQGVVFALIERQH